MHRLSPITLQMLGIYLNVRTVPTDTSPPSPSFPPCPLLRLLTVFSAWEPPWNPTLLDPEAWRQPSPLLHCHSPSLSPAHLICWIILKWPPWIELPQIWILLERDFRRIVNNESCIWVYWPKHPRGLWSRQICSHLYTLCCSHWLGSALTLMSTWAGHPNSQPIFLTLKNGNK